VGTANRRDEDVPGGAVDLAMIDLRDSAGAVLEDDRDLGDTEAGAVDPTDQISAIRKPARWTRQTISSRKE
jgi:hypothetical protein